MKYFDNPVGPTKEQVAQRIRELEEMKDPELPKWEPWKAFKETYENRDRPMDIPGPPCARCEYWQPRRDYIDIGPPYGETFNGVTLCVTDDESVEMSNDFSCFSLREAPAIKEGADALREM